MDRNIGQGSDKENQGPVPITRSKKFVSDQMLDALLRQFVEGTELTGEGLSYQRQDFGVLYEILPDAFAVKPTISRSEAVRLFGRAIRECRRADTVTAHAIAQRAEAIQKATLAVPQVPFTLWTKFRARNMAHVRRQHQWHRFTVVD